MGPRKTAGVGLVACAALFGPPLFSQVARPVPGPAAPAPIPQVRPLPQWDPFRLGSRPPNELPRTDLPRLEGPSLRPPSATAGDDTRTDAQRARDAQYAQAANELRTYAVQSAASLPIVRKLRRIGSP